MKSCGPENPNININGLGIFMNGGRVVRGVVALGDSVLFDRGVTLYNFDEFKNLQF